MKNTVKNTVIVELYKAEWCRFCKSFFPIWEKLDDVLKSDKIKNMLKSENVEVEMYHYEETENPQIMIDKKITSYPTIKITIKDINNNEKYPELKSRDPETLINTMFSSLVSDKLKKNILNEFNSKYNISGGYFNYVTKPNLKYYAAYLKYKKRYLDIKNS